MIVIICSRKRLVLDGTFSFLRPEIRVVTLAEIFLSEVKNLGPASAGHVASYAANWHFCAWEMLSRSRKLICVRIGPPIVVDRDNIEHYLLYYYEEIYRNSRPTIGAYHRA